MYKESLLWHMGVSSNQCVRKVLSQKNFWLEGRKQNNVSDGDQCGLQLQILLPSGSFLFNDSCMLQSLY